MPLIVSMRFHEKKDYFVIEFVTLVPNLGDFSAS